MKLIATKPFSYGTRRLQAGDVFETKTEREGKLLLAVKKVRELEDRPEQKISAPPKTLLNRIKEFEVKPAEEEEVVDEPKVIETPKVAPEVIAEEKEVAVTETIKEEEKPFVRSNQNTGRARTSRKN